MFIEFGIKDFIDILWAALMLYYVYRLMRESRSLNIFVGILIFIAVWFFVSQILEMRLLGSILDKLVSVGVLALIVIFQEDIRKFLYDLGAQPDGTEEYHHAHCDGVHVYGERQGGCTHRGRTSLVA